MVKLLPNEDTGETRRLRKDAVIYLLNQTVCPERELTKSMKDQAQAWVTRV